MPDRFQSLLESIIRADVDQAKELIQLDGTLATMAVTSARYEPRLVHWIYAGDTALHVAAAGYQVAIASILLQAGANPHSAQNHRHGQPLHYAADGHPESTAWDPLQQARMIELLLKSGSDLHGRDQNGATPLHRAVRTRCASAVTCLLRAGADATLRNKAGSTSFHLAVQSTGRGGSGTAAAKDAQLEIIRAFLQQGYRPSLQDARGKSVLEWARGERVRGLLVNQTFQ